MSVSANITVTRDTATPELERILDKTAPDKLARTIAEPLEGYWRRHLAALPSNKRGWPSTGFWEQASRAVVGSPEGGTVMLRCNKQGVRQRYHGGTISAVNAKALTIPISPVSYGRRASEFPGLFLLKTKKGAYLVQRGEAIGATGNTKAAGRGGNNDRRQRANLIFLFKLMQSVDQDANPAVIPGDDDMLSVAHTAILKELGGNN